MSVSLIKTLFVNHVYTSFAICFNNHCMWFLAVHPFHYTSQPLPCFIPIDIAIISIQLQIMKSIYSLQCSKILKHCCNTKHCSSYFNSNCGNVESISLTSNLIITSLFSQNQISIYQTF